MGIRFNKRMKLLPYVTMNVGKSGVSLTIGKKGKTLNINNTGVSVNVSLGQGVGYSKRLFTWKKLNLLSIFGLGKKADQENTEEQAIEEEEKTTKKKSTRRSKKTSSRKAKKDTDVPTLDEAIAQAEAEGTGE